VSSCWPYAHDKFEDEVFTENAQDWDEVVARMADPKMTRFRAMSLDEQTDNHREIGSRGPQSQRRNDSGGSPEAKQQRSPW
jgi:hypothetical protein